MKCNEIKELQEINEDERLEHQSNEILREWWAEEQRERKEKIDMIE